MKETAKERMMIWAICVAVVVVVAIIGGVANGITNYLTKPKTLQHEIDSLTIVKLREEIELNRLKMEMFERNNNQHPNK